MQLGLEVWMSKRAMIRVAATALWVSVAIRLAALPALAQATAGAKPATTTGSTGTSNGDWVQFKGDAARTGYSPDGLVFPPSLMWKHSSKAFPRNPASALATEGAAYFCSEKYVYRLDSETGAIVWWQQVEGPVRATPALGEDLLFVPSTDGKLYALRADSGAVEWIFPTSGALRSPPLVSKGRVVFGSDDEHVYCLSADNGSVVWKYKTGGDVKCGPASNGDYVFVLSNDSNVYCLKDANGQPYWKTPVTGSGELLGTPTVGSDMVWVAAGKAVYAIRLRTGKIEYSVATSKDIITSPAVVKDTVYIGSTDNFMYALDGRTGRIKWKVSLDYPILSTATAVQDKVLVGTEKGFVYALQMSDGKVVWKYQVQRGAKTPINVAAAPTVSRGSLYIVGDDGSLYGFKPWGTDMAEPLPTEAKIKLKARDGSMVFYPLDPPSGTDPADRKPPMPRMRGVPPVTFAATLTDEGSGIDESTLTLTMNGDPKKVTYHADTGLVEVELGPAMTPGVALRPIPSNDYTLILSARDWQGTELSQKYKIVIDNQLPPPEAAEKKDKDMTGGGAGGSRKGAGGFGQMAPQ